MEPYLLQTIVAFIAGTILGIVIVLLISKLKTGKMTSSSVKQEYQDYQDQVEQHFEETSKKFKDMTEQYQDLYKHLSVGATSLCRPDSVAAVMADKTEPTVKLENKAVQESEVKKAEGAEEKVKTDQKSVVKEPSANEKPLANEKPSAKTDKEPSAVKEPSTSKESSKNKKPSATKETATNNDSSEKKTVEK